MAAETPDSPHSPSPGTATRPIAALINRVLTGRYEILEFIGEGPLLAAYRARDRAQNRVVALKILLPQRAADYANIKEKLRTGLGEVLSLSHPSITRAFDVGADEENGAAVFVAEEYIRGIDLKERIRRAAPFQLTAATDCGIALAEALEFAHARGIAHGDVRPQNVLIGPEGQVKLSGFGIAEAQNLALYQDPGLLTRVVAYVASDAAASARPTASADLYALGVILFEMLTGDLPFKGDNPLQVAIKHAQEPVPSPRTINLGVPRALDGIVQKALGKRPEDRYLSAAEMLSDLREVRDSLRYGKSLAWSPQDRARIPAGAGAAILPSAAVSAIAPPDDEEADMGDATIVMPGAIRGGGALEARRGGAAVPPRATPAEAQGISGDEDEAINDRRGNKRKNSSGGNGGNGGNGSRWLTFINLFLGLALIGGIGGLVWMTMNFLQPTSEVVVPNLVGRSLTEAKTEGIDKKFSLAIVDQQYMDKVPSDQIYQQRPEPGRRIRQGKQVSLWVSRGPRMAEVPDVRDMSFDLARRLIEKNGLRVGNYTDEFDPLAPRGNVLRQSPESGENRPRGTKIDLVRSKGEEPPPTPEPLPSIDYVPDDTPPDDPLTDDAGNAVPEEADNRTRTFTVPYKVPRDDQPHRIRIDVIDRDGPRTIYDETLQAGEKVSADVQGIGKRITIKVYDNDALKTEQTK
ncbi:MAG: PASTA domain-containing protein [Cytophagales bacterium]|nr:PASTA domain-containing protein [Armatimonadota bacterium]